MLPGFHFLPVGNTVVVVFVIIVTVVIYNIVTNPLSRLPGPWYTRWSSAVLKYNIIKGRRALYVHSLHQKYGPIIRVSPTEVHISDIAVARQIHNVKSSFMKSNWYRSFMPPTVVNIFNTTDTEHHRHLRRVLSSPMSESSLKLVEGYIRRNIDLTIKGISGEMSQRGVADVFKWWMFMAADVIGKLSFGESFKMLESGKKNQYILDMERNGLAGGIRGTFPFMMSSWQKAGSPVGHVTRPHDLAALRARVVGALTTSKCRYDADLILG